MPSRSVGAMSPAVSVGSSAIDAASLPFAEPGPEPAVRFKKRDRTFEARCQVSCVLRLIGRCGSIGCLLTIVGSLVVCQREASADLDCASTALIDGPSTFVQLVQNALETKGIDTSYRSVCKERPVVVHFERHPSGKYKMHIKDKFGRESDRVVGDPTLAASLIESWIVIEEPNLGASSATAVPPAEQPEDFSPFAVPTRLAWIDGQGAFGSDDSLSVGGGVGACIRIGLICTGARARVLYDDGLGTQTADGWATRTNIDILGLAGALFDGGHLFLVPEIMVGAGWTRTRARDQGALVATTVGDLGPRVEASVSGGVHLSRRSMVAVEVGAGWAPAAPRDRDVNPGPGGYIPYEPRASLHTGLVYLIVP